MWLGYQTFILIKIGKLQRTLIGLNSTLKHKYMCVYIYMCVCV
jgi:hypothetical protein